jgi:hypothetical protein
MARVTNAGASAPQYGAPKKPKTVLPPGVYTVGIMDVRVDQTKSGTSYLCLSLCIDRCGLSLAGGVERTELLLLLGAETEQSLLCGGREE